MTLLRFSERDTRPNTPSLKMIFGRTAEMLAVRRKLEIIAKTSAPVLIQGESGTGKELCARMIHSLSDRGKGALIKVSCPAIPHSLVETELFGYEKGAFTGALTTKRGRVEQADGGTLLLDEVGSLDLAVQSKLLQILQDGTFMRVGGHEMQTIQTRLISVANRDLREQVEDGSFRLDLLYRINAMTLDLPPLRDRIEDLPDLIDFFLEQHARTFYVNPAPLSHELMRQMRKYAWPGNIRQLDNLIRSYVLIGDEEALMTEMMPDEDQGENLIADIDVSVPMSLKVVTKQATHSLERQIILKVLKANNWNRRKTANWLQISYRSLLYKLNELGPAEAPKLRHPRMSVQPATIPVPPGAAESSLRLR